MRNIVFAVLCVMAACVLAAPDISNVSVSSQSGFVKKVTIDYALDEDAIVTLDILTNGVSIGAANVVSVTGDVNRKVEQGSGKSIVWQAYEDWPDRIVTNGAIHAKLTAWALDNPPDVMVVDLASKSNIAFYASLDSLPGGGVTNDIYKTDKLVMRKIPAGGSVFTMGEVGGTGSKLPHFVAFTNDFYLGVYEFTQKQLFNVMGVRGSDNFADRTDSDILPCDSLPWGNGSNELSIRSYGQDARTQGRVAKLGLSYKSVLRNLCLFSGMAFDLPTGAQWEFACRAGTNTKFNDGSATSATMDELGWHSGNAGGAPHPVGKKKPNAFGLYDMHGNVMEWVLDWEYSADKNPYTSYDINPTGPTSNANYNKERRGGGYAQTADNCNSTYRSGTHVFTGNKAGFRAWAPAKMW